MEITLAPSSEVNTYISDIWLQPRRFWLGGVRVRLYLA